MITILGRTPFSWIDLLITVWFAFLMIGYFALSAFAYRAVRRELRAEKRRAITVSDLVKSKLQPTVTLVVPAHNEAASIVSSLSTLLKQQWKRLEIIVVTNGCTDDTLDQIKTNFSLEPCVDSYTRNHDALGAVRSAWVSKSDRRLRVIDIGPGGKADALNCGLERATGTYLCTIDADSLLAPDAIAQIILPFLERGSDVVAVGSVVRVLNGATIEDGRVTKPGLPASLIGQLQLVEYARGFQLGRGGWAEVGALPIISGAFAAFRTSALRVVGGFRTDTVGEDMEIVLRLHTVFQPAAGRRAIVFLPRPLCWTEVPEDKKVLKAQRKRWQRGLIEAVLLHKRMIGRRSANRRVGYFSLPFLAVLELFAPVLELIGIIAVFVASALGFISLNALITFLLLVMSLGLLLSMFGLLLEEWSGGELIAKRRHALILLWCSIIEQFGPRQQIAWWRLRAILELRSGRTVQWGGDDGHRGIGSVATVVRETQ